MDDAPYIAIREIAGRVEVDGALERVLGRPVDEDGTSGGVFGRWRWDGRVLEVVNDRYGFYPLFVWAERGRVAIAPSPLALLALGADPELDGTALAVFFRLGFFIGEDTPWKTIRTLPPGCTLRWEAGNLEVAARGRLSPRASRLSRSEAIDRFIEASANAVSRRLPESHEAVVPLSGGADSRHLLAELLAADVHVRCVTARYFPNRPNHDARIAMEIAGSLGLECEVLDQPLDEVNAEMLKNELTGFCADEHAWFIVVANYLDDLGRVTAYDGLAGDTMTTTLFLNEHHLDLFHQRRTEELARSLMKDNERTLKWVAPPDLLRSASWDVAHKRITEELESHVDAPNPIGSFLFWNRTRREIALMSHAMLGPHVVAHTPFLDHEVVDLMTGLPAHYFLDRRFHRDAIDRAHPHLASFPYAPKRAAREKSQAHIRRYARSLLTYWVTNAFSACRPTAAGLLATRAVDGRNKKGFGLIAYLIGLERAAITDRMSPRSSPERISVWT